jgi:hypothetical protein
VPGTAVVPCFKVNVVVLIVEESIVSLKEAAMFPLVAKPVAPLAGTMELTVGTVVPVPAELGNVMLSESRVTAAVRANSRPSTFTPVVTVMEAKAMMVPLNTEPVPKVAELPTCQKTLAA